MPCWGCDRTIEPGDDKLVLGTIDEPGVNTLEVYCAGCAPIAAEDWNEIKS